MALFIIRPWEKLVPSLGELHFERMYAIGVLAAVVGLGRIEVRFSYQNLAVGLFLIAVAASALGGSNLQLGWDALYKYATLVVFYFVLTCVVRTPAELCFMLTSFVVAMGVYLTKAQWEYFVHGSGFYTMGVRRLIGIEYTFGGPNDLAGSIVLSLPVVWYLFTVRRAYTGHWPRLIRWTWIAGLGAYLTVATSSIILTNSRSGMVAFALWVLMVGMRGSRWMTKAKHAVLGLVALGLLWFVLPGDTQDRLKTIIDPKSGRRDARESAEGRWQGFLAGVEMFRREPITGVGVGNFVPYRKAWVDGVPLEAHNLIGQLVGEMGIVGVVTFVVLLAAIWRNCRRTLALSKVLPSESMDVLLRLALACRETLVLLFFLGLFGHNLLRFNWLWILAFSGTALDCALGLGRRWIVDEYHLAAGECGAMPGTAPAA
jgi:O-antigen ligase